MKTALVIGGTGPTGPYVVNGLIDRGYEVTILHSGSHEVAFKKDIEHIHTDVHFRETLEAGLGRRQWDLVVAAYGRLQLTVDVLKGRTDRVVAMGGSTGSLAAPEDAAWGPMGRAFNLDEVAGLPETDADRNRLGFKMVQAEQALFRAHHEGHYRATQIAYPILYGPRQPGAHDWSILRRVLDGRRRFVIADGGIKLEARCFAANAAHAVLLAIDQPEVSAGQKYLVADDDLYSMRQRIEAIARIMGHGFEFIDMPWELAKPCHVLWRRMRECRFRDTRKIKRELGYRDAVDGFDALRQSVSWLLQVRPEPGGELETQLGDPFNYADEDTLIEQWMALRARMPEVHYPLPPPAHIYRHPSTSHEAWRRPA